MVDDRDEALRTATSAIASGKIVAIRGAGGVVLAVDATDEAAVSRLRARTRRPHEPFAVMARSLVDAERVGQLDHDACTLLSSPTRPIVLVPARGGVAPSVAPGLADFGLQLPPTPLHEQLLAAGPPLQIIARGAPDGLADVVLVDDRETRPGDSVFRGAIPIRRADDDAIELPFVGPPVLAVGGHDRTTVCVAANGKAFLSPRAGDLERTIARVKALAGVEPVAVAHDFHPDYRSTAWARAAPQPRVAVQHHHAHVAACLVDNGRDEVVTGVAFDGAGLGADGQLWGGEILEANLDVSRRRGHLRALSLAGGQTAIDQPWRVAAAALIDAGEPLDLVAEGERIRSLIALGVRTTSAGRWFDAVAALLGVARDVSYDGQAAAQLEAIAAPDAGKPFEFLVSRTDPFEIDLRPAIRELAREIRRGVPAPILAARFHATMAAAIVVACERASRRTVALTGGCFQNRRLLAEARNALVSAGFQVLVHRRVPPNDDGLALGQAAVAAYRLRNRPISDTESPTLRER